MSTGFVDLDSEALDQLIERVRQAAEHGLALSAEDLQLLLDALLTLATLQSRMADNDITLQKLRKLAGIVNSSESLRSTVGQREKPKRQSKRKAKKPAEDEPDQPIHQRCIHRHESLKKGDVCPECGRGKVYPTDPARALRITAHTPFTSTEHLLMRLRCNACGAYFTAEAPPEVTDDGPVGQTYGYTARAMMAIQRYFAAAPFARQQTLQQLFGFPISASTIFDQSEQLANAITPLFYYLKRLAASASLFYVDDTGNRILDQGAVEIPDRRTGKPRSRNGVYTSALIGQLDTGQRIILYQTNVGHAGEWLDEILRRRPKESPPPIIMSDALSRNRPYSIADYIQALCNAHCRREFVDVATRFPDLAASVLERYATIWTRDDSLEATVTPERRRDIHREHSLPTLVALRDEGRQRLDSGEVEPNSALGQAWNYLIKHFDGLTAFCHHPGAPIDNNRCERTLRLIVRGRNNSLFFKTQNGAGVADIITSVTGTAYDYGINVFDYLVALQRHADAVKAAPEDWLPWTYPAESLPVRSFSDKQ